MGHNCRQRSVDLIQGDCLDAMNAIAGASVDLVLCDLPYGITKCPWDRKIALEPLWRQYERICAPRGVIALFAQQPFATELAAPRLKWLWHDWVWDKGRATGFANAHRMPMRRHENVLIFYRKLPRYNPQGLRPCQPRSMPRRTSEVYLAVGRDGYEQRMTGYPQSILRFDRERGAVACQKPVELLEYLIRTYTRTGETVLDNAMGTGSAGVAAVRAGRRFIGIEIDGGRFDLASRRIGEAARVHA